MGQQLQRYATNPPVAMYGNAAYIGRILRNAPGNFPVPPPEAPPTEAPPTEAPPTEAPPTEAQTECTECHEMTTVGAPISSDSSARGDHVCMTCANESGSYIQLSDSDYVRHDEVAVCGICEDTLHETNTRAVDGEMVCNGCVENSNGVVLLR